MEEVLTFKDALELSAAQPNRHVFLGNGFSRACKNDIFSYDALFDRANFVSLSSFAESAFDALGTRDFEHVIEALHAAADILSLYRKGEDDLCRILQDDADGLREVLVRTIAGSHPDLLSDISDDSYKACKLFLVNFKKIFTLNYDLLLYWAVMRQEIIPEIACDDGFRRPESGVEQYVTWEIDHNFNQNVYYLHGALHFFDAGAELQKYTWSNTGIRLTDQIRIALKEGKYPLFVAEGKTEDKLKRIKHNAYLTKAFDSFSRIGGALFVFGHSLARNDEHFLKLIEKGRVNQLFVSIFGDPNSATNKKIINRALLIAKFRADLNATKRKKKDQIDLDVFFYDAQSAKVWG
jgi:hypothetical protein